MKARVIKKYAVLVFLGSFLMTITTQLYGQDEKHKARLSVDYQKIMGENSLLLINAKYKPEKRYEPVSNLNLSIYEQLVEDSLVLRGNVITDNKGNANFGIKMNANPVDSIIKYHYVVKLEEDEKFKNAKKDVKFFDVNIAAEAIVKDSMHFISATITDAMGSPLEGEKLEVKVQRLFAPLTIGESSYKSDDDGNVLVAIENPLPGVDGVLTFEIMSKSRSFGTVKIVFDAPIGKVVSDQSTFDKRTMWSPPNKTPYFLLIFPNLLIIGIWGLIVLLLSNLYKIYKS
jgi:hypothetical protein